MPASRRPDSVLELGGVALVDVARDPRVGTPAYVYDLDGMVAEVAALRAAFDDAPHLVAYAVKANSAGAVVRAFAAAGCGADVVSGAELALALACGVPASRIVYSGVAKADDELDLAIGAAGTGIHALQVESVEEVGRIAARARAAGRVARVSIRVNPGVDEVALDTHSYIATGHDEAKFGVPVARMADALAAIADQKDALALVGLSAHAGSQFTSTDAYLASARVLFGLAKDVRARFPLAFVDTGGGFGIDYGDGCPARPADFIRSTRALQREHGLTDLVLGCEPGRALVGAHGVLLARVLQRKVGDAKRRWLMIDAGMNDLMRPALYQARHRVVPLVLPPAGAPSGDWKVVGPVCESSDDFGAHPLPDAGFDHVALLDAGAYGFSMASCYNGRALPAEVFLRGGAISSISPRAPAQAWVDARLAAG
jgi:diaminopimelate decarboxylase